jgi:hypothetical protein
MSSVICLLAAVSRYSLRPMLAFRMSFEGRKRSLARFRRRDPLCNRLGAAMRDTPPMDAGFPRA